MKKALSIILSLAMILSFTLMTVSAAPVQAVPTASTVLVNGENVAFDAYNIAGNNYFKLRDLAFILNGTEKQFSVVYDEVLEAINLTTGQPYVPIGGEMAEGATEIKNAVPTTQPIYKDGEPAEFTAYNIEGYNYFRLRDIGAAFNFGVEWVEDLNTIVVDTSIGYTPEAPNTGRIAGQVIEATATGEDGDPISGASVELRSSATGSAIVTMSTDDDGRYFMENINIGNYYLEVSATGFITELFYIEVEAGLTTNVHRLNAVPTSAESGTVSGSIINAFTGGTIEDAITLVFRRGIDVGGGEVVTTITTSDGNYSVALAAGNYTVTASGSGYISSTAIVVSFGGATLDNQNIVVSPVFESGVDGEGSLRIVLTWGERPYDLDSHLVGPTPDGGRFHIWYAGKTTYYGGDNYANLDVDDTSSYGPETVTINVLVDGEYNYFIHDYSNNYSSTSTALRDSGATIRVLSSEGNVIRTFNVPTSGGASTLWHVFRITVANGQYTITPINEMGFNSSGGSTVGSDY